MQGYWESLQHLVSAHTPFVSVTLVDVIASAPANVVAKMLVTSHGLAQGTVGGGKIEMKSIEMARTLLNTPGSPTAQLVEWNLHRDVGMTCGGGVRLFFELYNVANWPIILFGAGHCVQALVPILLTLPCQLTVIDPRAQWLEKLPQHPRLTPRHVTTPMAEAVAGLPDNAFVLLMTMGHSSDQPILIEILKTRNFPFVGVIGSDAKAAALKRGLLAAGLPESATARYFCPLGLAIGTNDPAEIAISIAAQLLQERDRLSAHPTPHPLRQQI